MYSFHFGSQDHNFFHDPGIKITATPAVLQEYSLQLIPKTCMPEFKYNIWMNMIPRLEEQNAEDFWNRLKKMMNGLSVRMLCCPLKTQMC